VSIHTSSTHIQNFIRVYKGTCFNPYFIIFHRGQGHFDSSRFQRGDVGVMSLSEIPISLLKGERDVHILTLETLAGLTATERKINDFVQEERVTLNRLLHNKVITCYVSGNTDNNTSILSSQSKKIEKIQNFEYYLFGFCKIILDFFFVSE
jgi:hypothetical protein